MFFGLKIRGTKRELVVVEGSGGIFGALFDVLFKVAETITFRESIELVLKLIQIP